MIRLMILLLLVMSFPCVSFADEIAITFDDLPGRENETAAQQHEYNEKIIHALKKHGAPAIGFVNESKLYDEGETKSRTAVLQRWVDAGIALGNHTYSHKALSDIPLADYEADVLKGALVSKKMMQRAGLAYHYFRHPFLDTGTNPELRTAFEDFLQKNHYIIAPVTVDGLDWKFNQRMLDSPPNKRAAVIAEYISFTRAQMMFAKASSEKMFGRNIRHVWVMHASPLNAFAMEKLLQMAHGLGYQFVGLDRALEDPVYQIKDNYYETAGENWLYKWDMSGDKKINWSAAPQPSF